MGHHHGLLHNLAPFRTDLSGLSLDIVHDKKGFTQRQFVRFRNWQSGVIVTIDCHCSPAPFFPPFSLLFSVRYIFQRLQARDKSEDSLWFASLLLSTRLNDISCTHTQWHTQETPLLLCDFYLNLAFFLQFLFHFMRYFSLLYPGWNMTA